MTKHTGSDHLTVTLHRKMVVSLAERDGTSEQGMEELATAMMHHRSTQRQYYDGSRKACEEYGSSAMRDRIDTDTSQDACPVGTRDHID